MHPSTFTATGLTCGHCVSAVSEEIRAIEGVSDVHIDLVNGGPSTITVTANEPVTSEQIAAALDEAGDYKLV